MRTQLHTFVTVSFLAFVVPAAHAQSDECATATPIAGTGEFAYDTTNATTGTVGQTTTNCLQFGETAVAQDVWFRWNAPASGKIALTNCRRTTSDSKLAIYAGSACPGNGATALACNEDMSDFVNQSYVYVDVVAGADYLIQIGLWPGSAQFAPGVAAPGTFTIEYDGPTGCSYDKGSSDNVHTWGFNGDLCWLARFGFPGQRTTVSGVSVAFGSPHVATNLPNGTPANVALWDDPNDDGDPNDAVLLAIAPTTVHGVDLDSFQTIALPGTFTVEGVYFVGANVAEAPSRFPAPLDGTGCTYAPGRAWIARNVGAPFDFAHLSANSLPPRSMHTVGGSYRGVWLLRADCSGSGTGVASCIGDGVLAPCPCGNVSPAASAAGCLHGQGAAGRLVATGLASLANDTLTLQASGLPGDAPALFVQSSVHAAGGVGHPLGDGLSCLSGNLVRLGIASSAGGTVAYPSSLAGPDLSQIGGLLAPGSKHYQVWFRDSSPFCTSATFNLTNAWTVTWTP